MIVYSMRLQGSGHPHAIADHAAFLGQIVRLEIRPDCQRWSGGHILDGGDYLSHRLFWVPDATNLEDVGLGGGTVIPRERYATMIDDSLCLREQAIDMMGLVRDGLAVHRNYEPLCYSGYALALANGEEDLTNV